MRIRSLHGSIDTFKQPEAEFLQVKILYDRAVATVPSERRNSQNFQKLETSYEGYARAVADWRDALDPSTLPEFIRHKEILEKVKSVTSELKQQREAAAFQKELRHMNPNRDRMKELTEDLKALSNGPSPVDLVSLQFDLQDATDDLSKAAAKKSSIAE